MISLERQSWWNYLDKVQQDLIRQSYQLIFEEEKNPEAHADYSFIVFPAAKAYEGFLKKLFFDLGLISQTQFSGERFRIGRALNPGIYKDYPHESVYEKLSRYCKGEEISAQLWKTWKTSRNSVFHYFPDKENLISFNEAKKRVEDVIEAIDASFSNCQISRQNWSLKRQTIKNCLYLYLLVFVSWLIYRFFFKFPEAVEEVLIKPVLWLLPVISFILFEEKRQVLSSLGYAGKNFRNSLLAVLAFVFFFFTEGLVTGIARYKSNFFPLIISLPFSALGNLSVLLVTAIVEETFFRGYLFNRLWEVLGEARKVNLIISLSFVIMHLPIMLFIYKMSPVNILLSSGILMVMSLGSGFLFSITYNTIPSILWHFLWNWQVLLRV